MSAMWSCVLGNPWWKVTNMLYSVIYKPFLICFSFGMLKLKKTLVEEEVFLLSGFQFSLKSGGVMGNQTVESNVF